MPSTQMTVSMIRLGVLAAMLGAGACAKREAPPPLPSAPSVEPDSLRQMRYPTDRNFLMEGDRADAFQPTASGRPESALFGSVRTEKSGKTLVPSFHEGLDIAPLKTDRRGRPLDSIYAVADGTVAYVNRGVGNSNYGKYVVLVHSSTAGQLYTLYAHMAQLAPGMKAGKPVKAGQVLGVMGNTASLRMPMAQAHLHFELGLMANAHYDQWIRAQKLKPDHGIFNGGNLFGIDPLAVFQRQQEDPEFTFTEYLKTIPRVFEIVLAAFRSPDYFRRYPRLWTGPLFHGRAFVMAVSENGLPLQGWNAAEPDVRELGKKKWQVRAVSPEVLGRNGRRLIVRREGAWTLSPRGEKWLKLLTYP